jgi:hypothetical protein
MHSGKRREIGSMMRMPKHAKPPTIAPVRGCPPRTAAQMAIPTNGKVPGPRIPGEMSKAVDATSSTEAVSVDGTVPNIPTTENHIRKEAEAPKRLS